MAVWRTLFFTALIYGCFLIQLARQAEEECKTSQGRHQGKKKLKFIDFKKAMKTKLLKIAANNHWGFNSFALNGKDAEKYGLKGSPDEYKVKISSGPTSYNQIPCRSDTDGPYKGHLRKQLFCNEGKTPKAFQVEPYKVSNTWNMTWALDIDLQDMDMDFDSNMPNRAFSESRQKESNNNVNPANGETSKIAGYSFEISHNVTVEPRKMLLLQTIVYQDNVKIPFVSELFLSGLVFANFSKEDGSNKFRTFPITRFADGQFKKRDGKLVFNCTGTYTGATDLTSHFDYVGYKYSEKICDKHKNKTILLVDTPDDFYPEPE